MELGAGRPLGLGELDQVLMRITDPKSEACMRGGRGRTSEKADIAASGVASFSFTGQRASKVFTRSWR